MLVRPCGAHSHVLIITEASSALILLNANSRITCACVVAMLLCASINV